ncbi:hypothetical protein [Halarchaeum grantii]|uniref:hypothetical protein n=1 Tax=Halarchaeum grantii TaxID=1193105 RepID=UPI001662A987|nr:hypothetical protein [Halarchaeum grantii]
MGKYRKTIALYVVTYSSLGIAIGVLQYLLINWARTTYISAAQGQNIAVFGPIFVGLVFFQLVGIVFIFGTVLAAIFSIVFGFVLDSTFDRMVVGAIGSGAGTFIMSILAAAIPLIGGGTGQSFSIPSAIVPLFISCIIAAVVGGATAVIRDRYT